MRHKLLIGIFALFFVTTSLAHAQSAVPDPLQFIISPENPGPNQLVNIEVNGVGQFLGNSSLTWQENGKVVEAFAGQQSFTFTTGGVGAVTYIHLVINSPTLGVMTRDFVFNPSVVNLVWEADTYTPLLYVGKPLYSAGSNLRVVAFPTVMLGGKLVDPAKLSFQWKRNDTPDTSASGLGKTAFSFQGDQLQTEEDISVTIYSGNSAVGRGDIVIPASAPQVVLYARDPLRGELLEEGLRDKASLAQKEITLQAEPYFFATNSVKNKTLVYTWQLNDQETTGPAAAQGMLTLRQTGSGSGAADIGVTVQNTNTTQLIQAADTRLQLVFGQSAGSAISSFFGL
ncbi:MAG: hypothetical protein NT019_01365 [Candidatus Adlerbacteria bacterium]|nr:hypothetical protein [Candidatus Adlerbacteria bacterium]